MIDVPHEGDNRRARLEFLLLLNGGRRRRDYLLFYLVNTGAFFPALFFQNESVLSAIFAAISGSIVWLMLAKILCVISSAIS